ncbi:hypothetical protein [Psychrobium sp. 1_MG-2023]|uniref:hypothetical protein n=1 Tax=Psychrobium sp. 1_MG-2023 TaxID=3062624 RepID=UPI000C3422BD|nr:hypothetical protein [Psychrobium sp. 1_MG-2023]MDP2561538.1 hypothetical protein [Psychrobium sp. 1_MG-2023]PKF55001.1 hypothetical protein CW748_14575 [Alteromonadales bacterium alter-6D02]
MTPSKPIDSWQTLKVGFSLTKRNFIAYLPVLLIGVVASYFAVMQVIEYLGVTHEQLMESSGGVKGDSINPEVLSQLQFGFFLVTLVFAPLEVGLMMMGLKAARGGKLAASDILHIVSDSARIIILSVFTISLIQLGSMLFLLPGLFLMIVLSMAQMLMCDGKATLLQAIPMSFKALTKHWAACLLVYIILIGLLLLSAVMTLGVALILTIPFYMNVKGQLYHVIFDNTCEEPQDNNHSGNEFEA